VISVIVGREALLSACQPAIASFAFDSLRQMADAVHRKCNAWRDKMKTATLPSLRVTADFREAAESVLKDGETLSSFVEDSVRRQVQIRKSQADFIARGLAAREEAKKTGVYHRAEDVLAELKTMLDAKLAEDDDK
jgi:hypothetical protein